MEPLRIGNRQLHRHAIPSPAVYEIVDEGGQAAAAAGFGVVHLVNYNDTGDVGFFGKSPHPLGDGFDAILGVDEDDGGFNGEQGGAGFVGEHVEAGGVDEVDLDALPLGKGDGILHGGAAGDFFVVIAGGGGAVLHAALRWGHPGGMQQGGDQGGLAAVRMPHYSYVADLTSLVRFHGFSLIMQALDECMSGGWRRSSRSQGRGSSASSGHAPGHPVSWDELGTKKA